MTRRREPKWLKAPHGADAGFKNVEKPQWLSRVLAREGVLTPAELESAIRKGRVQVAGRVAKDPLTLVRPGDEIRLDGKPVARGFRSLVLMFHKPGGVVTSTVDPEGGGTVFERLHASLPQELARFGWHAVGRLDRNTTGLLLFTNDERFVQHATSPATHLPKTYVARVQGRADDAKVEPLRRGVTLDDGPARPAVVKVRAADTVELTITEGRNHQVKRMLAAVGLPVTALHREAVGGLTLDVQEGGHRVLTEQEVRERLGFKPG